MKSKFLFVSLGLFFLMFILHLLGSYLYLYWTAWWFDNLVHFTGGVGVGFFMVWLSLYSGIFGSELPSRKKIFFTSLFLTVVVGAGWELFEYANGLTQSTEGYALDTFHDLLADTFGGALAGFLAGIKRYV
ncbi:MAG: seg [Parcubacteria group bacterium]|nr:seg [Parcubacteria group bacterium]